MKTIISLLAISLCCSSCAVGAGVAGFSIVSNGLTQQAEKNLSEKFYNDFKVKEMRESEE